MATEPNAPDDDVLRQARAWAVLLKTGQPTTRDLESLKAWCAQSAGHARAWSQAAHEWQAVETAADAVPAAEQSAPGEAPTQAIKEKVTLCCGNVASVKDVDNLMAVSAPAPEAQYHDVVRVDTLSAIAKKFYGDANKYPVIFEANKPMLTSPDKIYPGQVLRIPPLA